MTTFINKLIKTVAALQALSGVTDDWARKLLSVYLEFRADYQENKEGLKDDHRTALKTAIATIHAAIEQIKAGDYDNAVINLWSATELVYGVQIQLQGKTYSEAETLILDYESVAAILQKQFSVGYGLGPVASPER